MSSVKIRNQGMVGAPLSSKVWGLLVSPQRRVQKKRMEGGWPTVGGFLLCLTVSLLLQGKMGKEQRRPECGSEGYLGTFFQHVKDIRINKLSVSSIMSGS